MVPSKELTTIAGQPLLKMKLIYDRQSVVQSVLSVKLPSGAHDQICSLSDNCCFLDLRRLL
jgi:hypothetical protein